MTAPETFFVVRCVGEGGHWHFYCIDCTNRSSHVSMGDQYWYQIWDVFVLNEDRCMTLTAPPAKESIDIIYGERTGTDKLAVDPVIDDAPTKQRIQLLLAQHGIYLMTEEDCSDLKFPCFFSDFPSNPICQRALIEFSSGLVKNLPEVRLEDELRKARYAEHPDDYGNRRIFPDDDFRIPEGLFLPATAESEDSKKSVAVYRIEKWISDKTAMVECHLADESVGFAPGCKLSRKVIKTDGKEIFSEIGTVLRLE